MFASKTKCVPPLSRTRSMSKDNVQSDVRFKKAKSFGFTFSQTIALAALCSSFAAIVTALSAVLILNNSRMDRQYNQIVGSITHSLVHTAGSKLRLQHNEHRFLRSTDKFSDHETIDTVNEANEMPFVPFQSTENVNGVRRPVAWLMSFPNSGTSFTIHMTREASNMTTASNYALEGEIKDKPSVPAIPGAKGKNGPWLELIPDRHTTIPDTILTKTHCEGYGNGAFGKVEKVVHTVRSFKRGCLSGTRAVETDDGLTLKKVMYNESLVGSAIHLYRHPLDNVVARFHLEYNIKRSNGDTKFTQTYFKNATGFARWCEADNKRKDVIRSPLIDDAVKKAALKIPCFNEFYRYIQWHNLANFVVHDMKIEAMILHYHEYSENYEKARDRVLNFLGLPQVSMGESFTDGKVYRSYYSTKEKLDIRAFIKEFASAETWEQLKDYDFVVNESESVTTQ